MHQRTATEYQIDRIGDDGVGEAAMQRPAFRAEFEHVAEDGNAAAARTDRRLAEHGEGCGDRSRIGVIAVVDDERGTAGRLDLDRCAASGDRD